MAIAANENAAICQLRFPRARSPNALANSRRAFSTIVFGRPVASGEAAGSGDRPPLVRILVERFILRLRNDSTQRAQRVGDPDTRPDGEAPGHRRRHGDRENGEDQRAADDLKQRTDRTEEVTRRDERGPTPRQLGPYAHDEIEEEDLRPDV